MGPLADPAELVARAVAADVIVGDGAWWFAAHPPAPFLRLSLRAPRPRT